MKLVSAIAITLFCAASAIQCGKVEDRSTRATCNFRLCNPLNGTFIGLGTRVRFGAPGDVLPPYICKTDGSVMRVLKTGNVFIRPDDNLNSFIKLTDWTPPGVTTSFPRKAFFSRPLPAIPFSGITRKSFTTDQYFSFGNHCVEMALRRFQQTVTDRKGVTTESVVNTRSRRDCISFRVAAERLIISLFWRSDDNLSCEIIEPDGDKLNPRSPTTEFGRVGSDNGDISCGFTDIQRETYYYARNLELGTYSVRCFVRSRCPGNERTGIRYRLSIVRDGEEMLAADGTTRVEDRTDFLFRTFDITSL